MRKVCCIVLMNKCTALCNEYHHECIQVSTYGSIMEVCMHFTSMVDFDWLDVLLGSAFISVLACALLVKIMFLALA